MASGRAIRVEFTAISVILALVLAILAGAGAALYQRSRPATYESVAVLLIDQPLAVSQADNDGPLAKLQRLRYQYADLLGTSVIGDPVSRQVGVPASQVEHDLVGSVPPNTFTLNVISLSKSASRSSLLAQAGASALSDYVKSSQAQAGVSPVGRVVLTEVTSPTNGVQVAPRQRRAVVAGLIAFVVVGVAFLIVADVLRRRR
jgi:capsular polysaccharide biosynthesis protein